MAIPLSINGAVFEYPENFDENWGVNATGWAQAVTNGMLQRQGGNFPLLADVDFGASFGLISAYYKSRTANVALTGQIRLAKTDTLSWRNNANSADLPLGIDVSNNLTFNGSTLSFTGSVNPGTANQLAYYATTSNSVSGLTLITASRALASNASGLPVANATTDTELAFVSGTTSNIQTQINTKAPSASPTFTGTVTVPNGVNPTDAAAFGQVGVITSWAAYTPTLVGFGTPTSVAFIWKRIGDTIYVNGKFVSGTPSASLATVSLPGGFTLLYGANGFNNSENLLGQYLASRTGGLASNDNLAAIVTDGATTTTVFFSSNGTTGNSSVLQTGTQVVGVSGNVVCVNFWFVHS